MGQLIQTLEGPKRLGRAIRSVEPAEVRECFLFDLAELIMDNLFDVIERHRGRLCVIEEDGREFRYEELLTLGADLIAPISKPRQFVVLEATNTLDWLAAYVALIRSGHVVLLTADGSATTRLIASQFNANWVGRRLEETWLFEQQSQATHDLHQELAVLLSTSGSTGSPKFIKLSHNNFLSNAHSIAEYLAFEPGELAITTLPPFYSYGLSVIHTHLVAGHALALSNRSVSDAEFWRSVDRFEATSFAGVPHSFDLLARTGFLERTHPSLRYFTQAGGRLSPQSVVTFATHAKHHGQRFYVMYGQTEASPRMAYVPPEDVGHHPDCIGRPIPGGALRIDATEQTRDQGLEVGELVYSGPNVMMGYASTSDELARDAEYTELRTGDLALRNANGYFQIVGRTSRFAKLFGLRVGFDELETRLAAADFEANVTGDDSGLVILTSQKGSGARIRDFVVSALKLPRDLVAVTEVDAVPLLASGKPDYRAMLQLGRAAAPTRRGDLRTQLANLLHVSEIADEDTFISLGGDSLSFVQASMILEDLLGEAPDGWERIAIADLEGRKPARHVLTRVETGVVARAAAICLVVLHHISEWHLNGAAYGLLIAAGANFARFSLPKLADGRLTQVLMTNAFKIIVPYFAVISLIFIYVGDVHAPHFLLFSNFTDGFFVKGVRRLTIYWFIETYINILFVICLVVSMGPVMSRLDRNGWEIAWTTFLIGLALRLCGAVWVDTPLFAPLGPLMMLHVFALGWLIYEADTGTRKAVVAGVGAAALYLLPINDMPDAFPLLVLMIAALSIGGRLPVGIWSARIITAISAASLYIYIMQPLILKPAKRLLVDGFMPVPYIVPLVLAVLALGISAWHFANLIERSLPNRSGLVGLSRSLSRRFAWLGQR